MQDATNIKGVNMNESDWLEMLGWKGEQVSDLRYAAYSYAKEGAYDVALSFFDALAVLSPNVPYDLQTLGALHLQMGSGQEALECLNQALEVEPEHLLTKLNRAKALFMLGYRKQALSQALELENCEDVEIASQASALVLAYSQ